MIVWLIVEYYVSFLVDKMDTMPGCVAERVVFARSAAAGKRKYGGRQPPREGEEVRSSIAQDLPEVDETGSIPAPPPPGPDTPLVERRLPRARHDAWGRALPLGMP